MAPQTRSRAKATTKRPVTPLKREGVLATRKPTRITKKKQQEKKQKKQPRVQRKQKQKQRKLRAPDSANTRASQSPALRAHFQDDGDDDDANGFLFPFESEGGSECLIIRPNSTSKAQAPGPTKNKPPPPSKVARTPENNRSVKLAATEEQDTWRQRLKELQQTQAFEEFLLTCKASEGIAVLNALKTIGSKVETHDLRLAARLFDVTVEEIERRAASSPKTKALHYERPKLLTLLSTETVDRLRKTVRAPLLKPDVEALAKRCAARSRPYPYSPDSPCSPNSLFPNPSSHDAGGSKARALQYESPEVLAFLSTATVDGLRETGRAPSKTRGKTSLKRRAGRSRPYPYSPDSPYFPDSLCADPSPLDRLGSAFESAIPMVPRHEQAAIMEHIRRLESNISELQGHIRSLKSGRRL